MEATFKCPGQNAGHAGAASRSPGIPTAISELFKNAHDAYARTRGESTTIAVIGLLVLRDDGQGMTQRSNSLDRWLTIATASSVNVAGPSSVGRRCPTQPNLRGLMLGEKGIGRLAIATIAPQVLVLTRALRDGSSCRTLRRRS